MEENIMLQFVENLKISSTKAYEFIGINYHKMSKSELADIVKEFLYAVGKCSLVGEHEEMFACVAEELESIYEEEE